jgi:Ubiquitin fold domain
MVAGGGVLPMACICTSRAYLAATAGIVSPILENGEHATGASCWLCVQERCLEAYSISCGTSLLYNNIFPKHKDRLGQKMSDLVKSVAKQEIPGYRKHFDVVVACEDEDGEDLDVPLVSIKFR